MELTEIKGTVFGYSKKGVCQYVSELNDIHATELDAQKQKFEKSIQNYNSQLKTVCEENIKLSEMVKSLSEELSAVKEKLSVSDAQNEALTRDYDTLSKETEDLRAKSDVISTAIINAEKCATSMINDANIRAKDMIDEAQVKVEDEVKRLNTAKTYISEVRDAVEETLKKIDAELGDIENDIAVKVDEVSPSESKKSSVKEKFGLLEKTLFKRA